MNSEGLLETYTVVEKKRQFPINYKLAFERLGHVDFELAIVFVE